MTAFYFPSPKRGNSQWQPDDLVLGLLTGEQEKVRGFPAELLIVQQLNQLMFKDELLELLVFLEQGHRKVRD